MPTGYDTNTTADQLVRDFSAQIAGKTVLITGVSPGGLGAFFVEYVAAAKPALFILAARDSSKLQKTADAASAAGVAVRTVELDLSSLANVRKAAQTVNSWADVLKIDVLVNNAGIMACDYAVTAEGFEKQLVTNHLGPFLFTNLILDKVLAAPEPRVVIVSSDGHRLSSFRWADYDFHKGENYDKWRSYGQSKTANILNAVALAKKLGSTRGLTAVSLHPGVIMTNLGGHIAWDQEFADLQAIDKALGNKEGWNASFDFKEPVRGVATHVFAAFAPELKSFKAPYVVDSHVADPEVDTVKSWATSEVEAERLWKLSEELVGQKFDF